MSEINIEVEAINFQKSVIQESMSGKFLFDYQAQIKVLEYIKLNLKPQSYILPKTVENSKIIDDFLELRSNYKSYIE